MNYEFSSTNYQELVNHSFQIIILQQPIKKDT